MKGSFSFRSKHLAKAALLCCTCVAAGGTSAQPANLTSVPQSTESRTFGDWGVDLTYRDGGIRPGDDFYQHVNGKWLAALAWTVAVAIMGLNAWLLFGVFRTWLA